MTQITGTAMQRSPAAISVPSSRKKEQTRSCCKSNDTLSCYAKRCAAFTATAAKTLKHYG